jgi:hypothetical protein
MYIEAPFPFVMSALFVPTNMFYPSSHSFIGSITFQKNILKNSRKGLGSPPAAVITIYHVFFDIIGTCVFVGA